MIKIYVCSQSVTAEYSPVASHSINYLQVAFSFSPDWYGLFKTAQFTQNGTTYNVLLSGDKCTLPGEIGEGIFEISVFGYDAGGTRRITTLPCLLSMKKSGFVADGTDPVPPTPDLYSQLLSKITDAVENIPQNLSEFENDAGFVTDAAIPKKLSQLTDDSDFAKNSDIPTKLSQFENDTDFIARNSNAQLELWGSTVTITGGSVAIAHTDYGFSVGTNVIHDVAEPQFSSDAATKRYVDTALGDIENALDGVISYQQSLIGG